MTHGAALFDSMNEAARAIVLPSLQIYHAFRIERRDETVHRFRRGLVRSWSRLQTDVGQLRCASHFSVLGSTWLACKQTLPGSSRP